jgi:hypothetical protein
MSEQTASVETKNQKDNSTPESPKPTVAVKGTPADLIAKFAPKGVEDQVKQNEEGQQRIDERKAQMEEIDRAETKLLQDEGRKKGGFMKLKLTELDEMKRKLQEAEEKLAKYQEQNVDELNKKIADLESQLASADTKKEAMELANKLARIEKERDELVNQYAEETKKLRDRLDFYELESNPEFQRRYVAPMTALYKEALDIVETDAQLKRAFQKALTANESFLRTMGTPDSAEFARDRDSIISEIIEGLAPFHQQRFAGIMNEFIRASKNHAQALIDHQQTSQEIFKDINQQKQTEAQKAIRAWTESLNRTRKAIEPELQIDKETETIIKKAGIEVNTERDEAIARAIVTDSSPYKADDITRVINQGALFPKAQAIIKAQQVQISELRSLVEKLQGSSPTNRSSGINQHNENRGNNLESFVSRFSPASR